MSKKITAPANKNAGKQKAKVVSRTTIIKMLNETKGRYFGSTHIGKDNKPHTVNGNRYKNQDNPMGYIKVYSPASKEMRLVNPQTITEFRFKGETYKARK